MGKMVCHKCDLPCCINPSHLFLGDALSNMQDKVGKGRAKWAQNVLTHDQVRKIRGYHSNGVALREITRLFPITRAAIKKVVNYKSYKYVN